MNKTFFFEYRNKDMDQGETTTKKFKRSIISERIFSSDFQQIFCRHWNNFTAVKTSNLEIIPRPFRVAKISNFLGSEEFIDKMKNELSIVRNHRNCTDLYQFEQTDDLSNVQTMNIKLLYETFQTDLLFWMERNMTIVLNNKMSMSSACYSDTDYLLCHDDNLSDRRIAFVLYLSKNWTMEDGGTLDLFDTDDNGLPRNVVRSIIPEYNSLLFFEVVDNSYHQVAEVISAEKVRWSINGWWHGPHRESNRPPRSELVLNFIKPEDTVVDLNEWITECYLFPGIIKEIQEDIEQESFAFLSNFLKQDMYNELSTDVISDQICWRKVGPADLRNYEIADENTLPSNLKAFYNIFKSIVFFRLLKEYTELDLVPDEERVTPKMHIELQRWSRGCYTLIYDTPKTPKTDSGVSAFSAKSVEETKDSNVDSEHAYDASSESSKVSKSSENRDICSPIEFNRNADEKFIPVARCNTSSSSSEDEDENENEEEKLSQESLERKSPKTTTPKGSTTLPASCSRTEHISLIKLPRTCDTEDSEVSDIGEYLSGSSDCMCEEEKEESKELAYLEPGVLDVIMQFHTDQLSEDVTIDYVNSKEKEGVLIHVPRKNNYLCLVYKTVANFRVQKYINHYHKGYFYNLICSYYE